MVSCATTSLSSSPAFELRLTLFKKGFHPFFTIFGGEQQVKGLAFKLQTFIEGHIGRLKYRFLGRLYRKNGLGSDLFRYVLSFFQQQFHGNNTVHQAKALGVGRGHGFSRKYHFHGAILSNSRGESLGAAATGNDPEINLRLAEAGGLRGDNDVATHGKFATAT